MINGNLEQFLDTGWYTESELYYDGYIFWCEAVTDLDTGETEFYVDRWRADCDGEYYHQYIGPDGNLVDYSRALSLTGSDMDDLKRRNATRTVFVPGKPTVYCSRLLFPRMASDARRCGFSVHRPYEK